MGNFSDQQTISTYWYNTSEDLRNAAAFLWKARAQPQRTTIGNESFHQPKRSVYFMLCGMSLEAMLKAIIVEKDEEPPKTHDLPTLAQAAGVSYDTHEMELLEILSAANYWHGRYPVPLKKDAWDRLIELQKSKLLDKVPMEGSPELYFLRGNNELDWGSFMALWGRACTALFLIARWITRE